MANTLNAYPTDLSTPCQVLLGRFSGKKTTPQEQVHAVYQILGVAAGNLYPDGPTSVTEVKIKDIWDRPDGMKSCPCPDEEECKKALEEGCKMRGSIGDFFKSDAGKTLLNMALSFLPQLLASL